MTNIENKTVQLMPTVTGADFKDRWDIMGLKNGKIAYRIDEVHLVYHGSPRAIGLGGKMYVYADKNKTEGIDRTYGALDGSILISDLEPKEIQYLNLSCCNNGNLDFNSNNGVPGYDDNMAISFLKSKNNIDKVTAWDGNAVYDMVYLELFDYKALIGFEYSKEGDGFKKWSIKVNGFERNVQGRITYYKDGNGNIQYVPEFEGVY